MAGAKGGNDALGSLLAEFGGLEGAAFGSRGVPMADMRAGKTPPTAPGGGGRAVGATSAPLARSAMPSAPAAPPAAPPAPGFADFDLDSLVSRSSSAAALNQPM